MMVPLALPPAQPTNSHHEFDNSGLPETLSSVDFDNAIWKQIKGSVQATLSAPSFETWIQPLHWQGITTNEGGITLLNLQAQSTFAQSWVQKHYHTALQRAAAQVLGNDTNVSIAISVNNDVEANAEPFPQSLPQEQHPTNQTDERQMDLGRSVTSRRPAHGLNPRYTFEQLVVGQHNRLAHAAAMAIAESPGEFYNPLFIYGGVGLGKTHISQAIGHFCHQVHPNKVVRYATAEQFTNELIEALAQKQIKRFRDKYRQVDVLLIDDVQFLEGKERTQVELFYTLNALYESGSQIVLTSDRPPQRLTGLDDRLRSRCEWGLITDIQAPDLETRIAILRKKADREGLFRRVGSLNQNILTQIAQTHATSIRELEGALNQIAAYSLFNQTSLNTADVQRILQPHQAPPESLSLHSILKQVAHYYHLEVTDLKGKSRRRDICTARHIAIHVMRQLTHASFPQIAVVLDKKSHTSILHGFEKMQTELMQNPSLSLQMEELHRRIRVSYKG